jgi:hypothetical protein
MTYSNQLKLHLTDSTYNQAVDIKENKVVNIKDFITLIDLVVLDMPEDSVAPIILGKHF